MDRFGGWTTNFLVINKGRLAIGWPNWSGHLSMEFGTPFEWETSGFMGFHFEKRVLCHHPLLVPHGTLHAGPVGALEDVTTHSRKISSNNE
jgi:hypothetical protein